MTELDVANQQATEALIHYGQYDAKTDSPSDLHLRVDILVIALANLASLIAKDEINFHNRTTTPAA